MPNPIDDYSQTPRPDERPGDRADDPGRRAAWENPWQSRSEGEMGYAAGGGVSGQEEPGGEMGFFDHLEELRWRIIKALIAIVVTSVLCAIYLDFIIQDILLGPLKRLNPPQELQNTEMMGQLTLSLQAAMFGGLILAIPIVLWQFWGFIRPGLYPKERKYVRGIAVATIFCFLVGIAFAYFVMVPTSLAFTSKLTYEGIKNQWTSSSYFSFILGFVLSCGVVFEMPMLSYALSRFGILSPSLLKQYRRHAVVVILIAAAIITPTPDPINQMILAVPLYILFELSILVAGIAARQRRRQEQYEATDLT